MGNCFSRISRRERRPASVAGTRSGAAVTTSHRPGNELKGNPALKPIDTAKVPSTAVLPPKSDIHITKSTVGSSTISPSEPEIRVDSAVSSVDRKGKRALTREERSASNSGTDTVNHSSGSVVSNDTTIDEAWSTIVLRNNAPADRNGERTAVASDLTLFAPGSGIAITDDAAGALQLHGLGSGGLVTLALENVKHDAAALAEIRAQEALDNVPPCHRRMAQEVDALGIFPSGTGSRMAAALSAEQEEPIYGFPLPQTTLDLWDVVHRGYGMAPRRRATMFLEVERQAQDFFIRTLKNVMLGGFENWQDALRLKVAWFPAESRAAALFLYLQVMRGAYPRRLDPREGARGADWPRRALSAPDEAVQANIASGSHVARLQELGASNEHAENSTGVELCATDSLGPLVPTVDITGELIASGAHQQTGSTSDSVLPPVTPMLRAADEGAQALIAFGSHVARLQDLGTSHEHAESSTDVDLYVTDSLGPLIPTVDIAGLVASGAHQQTGSTSESEFPPLTPMQAAMQMLMDVPVTSERKELYKFILGLQGELAQKIEEEWPRPFGRNGRSEAMAHAALLSQKALTPFQAAFFSGATNSDFVSDNFTMDIQSRMSIVEPARFLEVYVAQAIVERHKRERSVPSQWAQDRVSWHRATMLIDSRKCEPIKRNLNMELKRFREHARLLGISDKPLEEAAISLTAGRRLLHLEWGLEYWVRALLEHRADFLRPELKYIAPRIASFLDEIRAANAEVCSVGLEQTRRTAMPVRELVLSTEPTGSRPPQDFRSQFPARPSRNLFGGGTVSIHLAVGRNSLSKELGKKLDSDLRGLLDLPKAEWDAALRGVEHRLHEMMESDLLGFATSHWTKNFADFLAEFGDQAPRVFKVVDWSMRRAVEEAKWPGELVDHILDTACGLFKEHPSLIGDILSTLGHCLSRVKVEESQWSMTGERVLQTWTKPLNDILGSPGKVPFKGFLMLCDQVQTAINTRQSLYNVSLRLSLEGDWLRLEVADSYRHGKPAPRFLSAIEASPRSWYHVLGVWPDASPEAIKAAFAESMLSLDDAGTRDELRIARDTALEFCKERASRSNED